MNYIAKVIFGLIFLIFVTPIGLLLRALGIDYLNLKIDKDAATYWKKHN